MGAHEPLLASPSHQLAIGGCYSPFDNSQGPLGRRPARLNCALAALQGDEAAGVEHQRPGE